MALDTSIDLIEVEYNSTPFNIPEPTAKGLADGSLTSFSAPALGVTSLAVRRFYNFTNLQKLDLTGVTDIPEYSVYGCTGLTSLTIGPNTTNIGTSAFYGCDNNNLVIDLNMNGSVGGSAFRNAKVRSIKGTYSAIGTDAFGCENGRSILEEVDIKVNGGIGSYAFGDYNKTVSSFNLDPAGVITFVGQHAFYNFGSTRANASTNVFDFDFRNGTFTSVESSAFAGDYSYKNKYMNIYFPSTLTTITNYVFQYTDHLNIYYKNVPSLNTTNAFNSATNFKNFFPYNLVQTAKTSTNWSSSTNNIISSIYGYAEENSFTQGQTLPDTDADGYALTWYSDIAMTQQVTTVADPTQIYYCAVGSQIKTPLVITEHQATCTVSDGVNTYANGDLVPVGATITITAVGDTGYPYAYIFTLDGTTIASGDTYTVVAARVLAIKCLYWDGVTPAIFPNFADNSWDQIALAINIGQHRTLWPVTYGNTVSKPITLTNGQTMNLRLADTTADRYEFADGSGYSQAVLEMDAVVNQQCTMRGGKFVETNLYNSLSTIYDLLPTDIKALVKEIKVPYLYDVRSGSGGTVYYATVKCFPPSANELGSGRTPVKEGACYQYYNGTTNLNDLRIKKLSSSAAIWWTRSQGDTSATQAVTTTGSIGNYSGGQNYISVCLVIG